MPIFTSFSGKLVSDQYSTTFGSSNVAFGSQAEVANHVFDVR